MYYQQVPVLLQPVFIVSCQGFQHTDICTRPGQTWSLGDGIYTSHHTRLVCLEKPTRVTCMLSTIDAMKVKDDTPRPPNQPTLPCLLVDNDPHTSPPEGTTSQLCPASWWTMTLTPHLQRAPPANSALPPGGQ